MIIFVVQIIHRDIDFFQNIYAINDNKILYLNLFDTFKVIDLNILYKKPE